MKPTIFDERVAKALHRWQQGAKKNIKKNRQAEGSATPSPKMPSGPPLCNEGKVDSIHSPPKLNNFHNVHFGKPLSLQFGVRFLHSSKLFTVWNVKLILPRKVTNLTNKKRKQNPGDQDDSGTPMTQGGST